jgi:hypothetical protein
MQCLEDDIHFTIDGYHDAVGFLVIPTIFRPQKPQYLLNDTSVGAQMPLRIICLLGK